MQQMQWRENLTGPVLSITNSNVLLFDNEFQDNQGSIEVNSGRLEMTSSIVEFNDPSQRLDVGPDVVVATRDTLIRGIEEMVRLDNVRSVFCHVDGPTLQSDDPSDADLVFHDTNRVDLDGQVDQHCEGGACLSTVSCP